MKKNIRDERMIKHIVSFIEQEADARLFLEDEEQKCIVIRGYLRFIKLKQVNEIEAEIISSFPEIAAMFEGRDLKKCILTNISDFEMLMDDKLISKRVKEIATIKKYQVAVKEYAMSLKTIDATKEMDILNQIFQGIKILHMPKLTKRRVRQVFFLMVPPRVDVVDVMQSQSVDTYVFCAPETMQRIVARKLLKRLDKRW